jgi:phage terminase Nu1 subunit (DNA packaging protein)
MKNISGPELAELVGITERRLFQLAEKGFIPKPESDSWPWPSSVQALFQYYRGADELRAEKTMLTRAQRQRAELDLQERQGKLVEVERVLAAMTESTTRARAMLDAAVGEITAKAGGLPSDQQAKLWTAKLAEIYAQLCKSPC